MSVDSYILILYKMNNIFYTLQFLVECKMKILKRVQLKMYTDFVIIRVAVSIFYKDGENFVGSSSSFQSIVCLWVNQKKTWCITSGSNQTFFSPFNKHSPVPDWWSTRRGRQGPAAPYTWAAQVPVPASVPSSSWAPRLSAPGCRHRRSRRQASGWAWGAAASARTSTPE